MGKKILLYGYWEVSPSQQSFHFCLELVLLHIYVVGHGLCELVVNYQFLGGAGRSKRLVLFW